MRYSLTLNLHLTLTLGLVALATGCGGASGPKAPDQYPVSGTVTVDGQPLAEGSIVLDPEDGKSIPASGAVKDGAFSFKSPVGNKVVRINAQKLSDQKDEYGGQVSMETVAEQFNLRSTLKTTVNATENKDLKFEVKGVSAKK
jgi:hypothetical protein